jgi:hypothetical protein
VPSSTSASPCTHPTTGASFSYPIIPRFGDGYETDFIAPGTYNVALARYGYFPNYRFDVLTDTVQVTVRGSERFDCELALVGSGQSSTCLVSPYFDDDADGVSLSEENGAPNNGDGDNNGAPDSEQANVASLVDPTVVDPDTQLPPTDGSNYITLASKTIVETTGEPAPLTSVKLAPVPSTPPPDPEADPQTALISFTADFRDPETGALPAVPVTAKFEVYLPSPATQYWKYDEDAAAAGTDPWTDATALASFDAVATPIGGVDRWRVVLTITDGGFGDADGTPNGIIDDPGMFTFGGRIQVTRPTITCPPTRTFIVGQPDATLTAAVTGIDATTIEATVSTEAAGPRSVKIIATNLAGTATEDCGYTVTYRFEGFQQPIDTGVVNRVKAGRTVPVKWRLTEWDGSPVDDRASFVRLTSGTDTCMVGAPTDNIETTTTGSGLTYTGDGNWLYNWKTTGLVTGCRELRLQIYGAPEPVTAAFDLR